MSQSEMFPIADPYTTPPVNWSVLSDKDVFVPEVRATNARKQSGNYPGALFPVPFESHHCVPLTFAHLRSAPSAEFATELAARAKAISRVPDTKYVGTSWGGAGETMLSSDGFAFARRPDDLARWLDLARLRLIERKDYPFPFGAPTVFEFAREYPEGRWFVAGSGHAVAIRDGVVHGTAGDWMRVEVAARVEESAP